MKPKPKTEQKRHVAEVTLLESFSLGRNTGKNAGIEIKVFAKGGKPQLGTIKIGQGSFEWWPKQARNHSHRFSWAEFADFMEKNK